ncbi:cytochrome P450 [Amycolatopsis acidicola]|uniref:Cytochrome P450 n=1 Tax=Amycolatopsis acidicola TaxID=2596893 RepID=A0A5N0V3S8_9PSEU|nr:cytochrome P450 [Amycolatopsis acidicola]
MYRQLRETRPVHRSLGTWVLTRHADVRTVLHDRSFSAGLIPRLVSEQARRLSGENVPRIERLGRKSLVFTDNPDHARLRGLVNRAFTAPTIAKLRPVVEKTALRLAESAARNGGMDVIAEFAAPLPVAVLSEWMALPDTLRENVGRWTHDIRFLLEPGLMKGADFARVAEVVDRFAAALDDVVQARREQPGEDLISRLLASGDRLSGEELVFVCMMCFVAGNETTKSLIGNGSLAFLRHGIPPGAGAVGEALRYDSPLQLTKRLATRDVEIGGETIRAGDQVLLCLGAANRDPGVFADPDRFDPARDTTGHLAFGHGMHGCLGGLLAELQAEVAFETLSGYRLSLRDEELEWQDQSFIVRGLKRLPVTVGSAR